ncbi:glycoside hydrolase family 97 protein [Rhodopirellula sp. MGV]|uniref:glycoside hydrolase family 97 protein n=1 Tax=Rhodopirellula sp. MGV TaxID=2023130 RepID=UPI000B96EEF9|nr:glycoside hydrolase family 97 protein [Rhodopirellula sp. MGV]OYP29973.1 hypothetical protein CGZ80_23430 [Rhodopirellula sp. MGV]PNY33429.1 glycoside hydrolase [Rhodopirellula baltica]
MLLIQRMFQTSAVLLANVFAFSVIFCTANASEVRSPDGKNVIVLESLGKDGVPRYSVRRQDRTVISPSVIRPVLAGELADDQVIRINEAKQGEVENAFTLPWGKTDVVQERARFAVFDLENRSGLRWQIELRAYNDGVAFRYRIPEQAKVSTITIQDESTQFDVQGSPDVLFNTFDNFINNHESLYDRQAIDKLPQDRLIEMPALFLWQDGSAAAITEASVRHFAGGYLQHPAGEGSGLQFRLSPHLDQPAVSVQGDLPLESPWRVVMLADQAGELLESNLLLCLNEPAEGDYAWLKPGKTTFHWWNGVFEKDFELPADSDASFKRHCRYIDFCAKHNIAYHGLSGDGYAWYKQSKVGYGQPGAEADVCTAREEIRLPEVIEYAKQRGVGIRLWVHWEPLSRQLEEAFAAYESWGIKGLMVDFLDRDDQAMNEFSERMLKCAAKHKLHIQIHGSPKYSGEQRTFPNLFNREGVLNLEYLKWSDKCTPDHNVNVAYTRGLTGPVDYHQGGFRSVSRAEFEPRDLRPVVMGTRCHHMAMYVVYENPMPMVADTLDSYEGQPGFDFVAQVPTTWDETKFVVGEPGKYIVLARRQGDIWYVGGMTNWDAREVELSLDFLPSEVKQITLYRDGSMDESKPNEVQVERLTRQNGEPLKIQLAPGGGFTMVCQ